MYHLVPRLGDVGSGIGLCATGRDGSIAVVLADHNSRGRRPTRETGTRYAMQAPSTASEFRKGIGVGPQVSSDRQREAAWQLYQPHVSKQGRFRHRYRCAVVQLLEFRVQPAVSSRWPSRCRSATHRRPVGRPTVEKCRGSCRTRRTAARSIFCDADKARQTLKQLTTPLLRNNCERQLGFRFTLPPIQSDIRDANPPVSGTQSLDGHRGSDARSAVRACRAAGLECPVPGWRVVDPGCSEPPTPAERIEDVVHSEGSASPDIHDELCRSVARQNAFACGQRAGVFSTVRPITATVLSTAAA
jgi:hypothetical protein